jgi:transposase
MILTIELSPSQKEDLNHRVAFEKDARIWRRLQAVKLRIEGVKSKDIAAVLGVRIETITAWMHIFLAGGIEALATLQHKGSVSVLAGYEDTITELVKKERISTLKVLRQRIQEEFDIAIGETGLFKWCKKKLNYPLKKHA